MKARKLLAILMALCLVMGATALAEGNALSADVTDAVSTNTNADVAAKQMLEASGGTISVLKKKARASVTAAPGTVFQLDLGGAVASKFKSSRKKVATVDGNGFVTINGGGKTKISCKVGKNKRVLNLTVKDSTVPRSIALNMSGTNIVAKGTSVTLTATLPEGTYSGIKWKSTNKKVASVSNGVVTFKKKGKATITATTVRGKKKAKVTFEVKKGAVPAPAPNVIYVYVNAPGAVPDGSGKPSSGASGSSSSSGGRSGASGPAAQQGTIKGSGSGSTTQTNKDTSGSGSTENKVDETLVKNIKKAQTLLTLNFTYQQADSGLNLDFTTTETDTTNKGEIGENTKAAIAKFRELYNTAYPEKKIEAPADGKETNDSLGALIKALLEQPTVLNVLDAIKAKLLTPEQIQASVTNNDPFDDTTLSAIQKYQSDNALTASNGIMDQATILKLLGLTGFTVSPDTLELGPNETAKLSVTKVPNDSTAQITFTSSDEKIAKVSAEGEVTAVADGKATITVSAVGSGIADKEVSVTVNSNGASNFEASSASFPDENVTIDGEEPAFELIESDPEFSGDPTNAGDNVESPESSDVLIYEDSDDWNNGTQTDDDLSDNATSGDNSAACQSENDSNQSEPELAVKPVEESGADSEAEPVGDPEPISDASTEYIGEDEDEEGFFEADPVEQTPDVSAPLDLSLIE